MTDSKVPKVNAKVMMGVAEAAADPIHQLAGEIVDALEEYTVDLEKKKGKFRLQHRRVLLTYREWIDKPWFLGTFLKNVCGTNQPRFARVAHETGKKSGLDYKHSHVAIEWNEPFQTTSARKFDIVSGDLVLHPNIRYVKTKTHWHRVMRYLAKDDKENADLLEKFPDKEVPIFEQVTECRTLIDAMKLAKRPSDAMGIDVMYRMKPNEKKGLTYEHLLGWQQSIVITLRNKGNPRFLHWIWDPIGGSGKSTLWNFVWNEFPNDAIVLKDVQGASCCSTANRIIMKAVASGNTGRIVFVEFSRSAETHKNIYTMLEQLQDGACTAEKYDCSNVFWKAEHIFVLANFLPDRSKMSGDRINVLLTKWGDEKCNLPPGSYEPNSFAIREVCRNRSQRLLERQALLDNGVATMEPKIYLCPIQDKVNSPSPFVPGLNIKILAPEQVASLPTQTYVEENIREKPDGTWFI